MSMPTTNKNTQNQEKRKNLYALVFISTLLFNVLVKSKIIKILNSEKNSSRKVLEFFEKLRIFFIPGIGYLSCIWHDFWEFWVLNDLQLITILAL